MNRIKFKTSL